MRFLICVNYLAEVTHLIVAQSRLARDTAFARSTIALLYQLHCV